MNPFERRLIKNLRLSSSINWWAKITAAALPLLFSISYFSGCGYRISARYTGIPESVHTIAVPMVVNKTPKYQLEIPLTDAIKQELSGRGSFSVTADPSSADAVLNCVIKSYGASPFGLKNSTSTVFLVQLVLDVKLTERKTGKILFQNPTFIAREEYILSQRTSTFFSEEKPAIDRLSRTAARSLAATILENF